MSKKKKRRTRFWIEIKKWEIALRFLLITKKNKNLNEMKKKLVNIEINKCRDEICYYFRDNN